MATAPSIPKEARPICGIVMPISAIDGCSEHHWVEVRTILEDSIEDAGLDPNLVSEADDVGIIQKRIIHNLYENPIVVCDVSAKNPNVMFELGLRLAFDRPTIVVKDDKTAYSFDTAPIEHLEYPRDLRFARIVEFQEKLRDKIQGTLEASKKAGFTTFLKNFGTFKVAKLETEEVSKEDFLLEEIRSLRQAVAAIAGQQPARPLLGTPSPVKVGGKEKRPVLCLRGCSKAMLAEILSELQKEFGFVPSQVTMVGADHEHLYIGDLPPEKTAQLKIAASRRCTGARILVS